MVYLFRHFQTDILIMQIKFLFGDVKNFLKFYNRVKLLLQWIIEYFLFWLVQRAFDRMNRSITFKKSICLRNMTIKDRLKGWRWHFLYLKWQCFQIKMTLNNVWLKQPCLKLIFHSIFYCKTQIDELL